VNLHPGWLPQGSRVFYESRIGNAPPAIYARAADGSGTDELIVKEGVDPSVSTDGRLLAYSALVPNRGYELFYMPLDGRRTPVHFLEAPADQRHPVLSPDGRYVAYQSNESDQYDIYLKPFPTGDGKWQVSTGGGVTPRWDGSGKKLYFVQGDTLMEVDVAAHPTLVLGTPRPLFSGAARRLRLDVSYDISPDGKSFAVVEEATEDKAIARSLRVVENWYAEFMEKQKK
jgi:Tol biopolymer transport system component